MEGWSKAKQLYYLQLETAIIAALDLSIAATTKEILEAITKLKGRS